MYIYKFWRQTCFIHICNLFHCRVVNTEKSKLPTCLLLNVAELLFMNKIKMVVTQTLFFCWCPGLLRAQCPKFKCCNFSAESKTELQGAPKEAAQHTIIGKQWLVHVQPRVCKTTSQLAKEDKKIQAQLAAQDSMPTKATVNYVCGSVNSVHKLYWNPASPEITENGSVVIY